MFPVKELPDTIIFANGEPSTDWHTHKLLQNAHCIVCCDGAVQKLLKLGYEPHIIIGDCDSITPELKEHYQNIIIRNGDEEYNDLQKALRYVISLGKQKVAILGGGGYRDDHALANLSIAALYSQQIDILMITQYGIFVPIQKTTQFLTTPGQQVSIFSFDNSATFTFHGLRYPVKNRKFQYLWEGSLNEAIDKNIVIECTGGNAMIYFAHQKEVEQ